VAQWHCVQYRQAPVLTIIFIYRLALADPQHTGIKILRNVRNNSSTRPKTVICIILFLIIFVNINQTTQHSARHRYPLKNDKMVTILIENQQKIPSEIFESLVTFLMRIQELFGFPVKTPSSIVKT